MTNSDMSLRAGSNQANPFHSIEGLQSEMRDPQIDLADNLRVVAKTAWNSVAVTHPGGWPAAFKITLAIPIALVLITATIGFVVLAALFHVIAFPIFMQKHTWSAKQATDYIRGSFKEISALIPMTLLYPLGGVQLNPKILPYNNLSTPIIFLNGYLHNSSASHYLRDKLENEEGVGPFYTINIGSPTESIQDKAARTKILAEQIAKETGRSDVVLIGHSMGGLVAAEYATVLAPKGSVKAVITLGSPLQGTKIAHLGIGQAAREMTPNSPYINRLQDKIFKKAYEIAFYHFGSNTDLITPEASAQNVQSGREGEGIIASRIYCRGCGHASFLYSKTVAEDILSIYTQVI